MKSSINLSLLCGTAIAHVWHFQSILIHLFVSVSSIFFFWMSWIINLLKTFLLIPLNLLSWLKKHLQIPLSVCFFCQDVVQTEWTAMGRLDLVSWGPRLGRLEGPWWKGVPQTTRPLGSCAHWSLLLGHQAVIWKVSYLQQSLRKFNHGAF